MVESDRTEQAARTDNIKTLKTGYEQIEARIETMYMDKLDGRIRQELFDRQTANMRREQDGLLRRIQDIEKAVPAPNNAIFSGVLSVRLFAVALMGRCVCFASGSAAIP